MKGQVAKILLIMVMVTWPSHGYPLMHDDSLSSLESSLNPEVPEWMKDLCSTGIDSNSKINSTSASHATKTPSIFNFIEKAKEIKDHIITDSDKIISTTQNNISKNINQAIQTAKNYGNNIKDTTEEQKNESVEEENENLEVLATGPICKGCKPSPDFSVRSYDGSFSYANNAGYDNPYPSYVRQSTNIVNGNPYADTNIYDDSWYANSQGSYTDSTNTVPVSSHYATSYVEPWSHNYYPESTNTVAVNAQIINGDGYTIYGSDPYNTNTAPANIEYLYANNGYDNYYPQNTNTGQVNGQANNGNMFARFGLSFPSTSNLPVNSKYATSDGYNYYSKNTNQVTVNGNAETVSVNKPQNTNIFTVNGQQMNEGLSDYDVNVNTNGMTVNGQTTNGNTGLVTVQGSNDGVTTNSNSVNGQSIGGYSNEHTDVATCETCGNSGPSVQHSSIITDGLSTRLGTGKWKSKRKDKEVAEDAPKVKVTDKVTYNDKVIEDREPSEKLDGNGSSKIVDGKEAKTRQRTNGQVEAGDGSPATLNSSNVNINVNILGDEDTDESDSETNEEKGNEEAAEASSVSEYLDSSQ